MRRLSKTELTPKTRAMTSLALAHDPPPVVSVALEEAKIAPEDAILYLRCSKAPEAVLMCLKYDSLVDTEKQAITLDHLCAAAKNEKGESVDPSRCLGIITEQMFSRSISVTNLIAASRAPDVMKAAVWYAGTPDGHQDRKMLLQTIGVAPVPKNQSTYINVSGNKIDNSTHVTVAPTLESVLGDVDLDKIIDAEVS